MRLGTTLSSVAHVAILSWGLVAATAPEPMIVPDVESVPIEIIPIEEAASAVKGDKEAKLTDTPAPTPTKKPEVPEAVNVGDAKKDVELETKAKPDDVPTEETTEAAKAVEPKPAPVPEKKPLPVPEATQVGEEKENIAESDDVPEPKLVEEASEITEKPEPAPEPEPEPVEIAEPEPEPKEVAALEPEPVIEPEPQVVEDVQEQLLKENRIPVPSVAVRPKPDNSTKEDSKKLAALTKDADGKPDAEKKKSKKETKLQNKKKASSGGQKKSVKTASIGTSKGKSSGKLSRSELDALRSAVEKCSRGLSGQLISENLAIKIVIRLAPDGNIKSIPLIDTIGGTPAEQRRFAPALLRAVKRCAPYDFLPKDKYDTWAEIVPTFYPAKMFQ